MTLASATTTYRTMLVSQLSLWITQMSESMVLQSTLLLEIRTARRPPNHNANAPVRPSRAVVSREDNAALLQSMRCTAGDRLNDRISACCNKGCYRAPFGMLVGLTIATEPKGL